MLTFLNLWHKFHSQGVRESLKSKKVNLSDLKALSLNVFHSVFTGLKKCDVDDYSVTVIVPLLNCCLHGNKKDLNMK